uniref:Uncharacterized protein n=1 Tax=viral metagenome TaxID=1070528 RepID=A0A6H1Z735_9ZZZZ
MEKKDLEEMTKGQLIDYLIGLQTKIDKSEEDRETLKAAFEEVKSALDKKKEKPKAEKGFLSQLFGVEDDD